MNFHSLEEYTDAYERDFMVALQSLVEGRPTKKILKDLLRKKGRLPINAVNLAIEAGHSRTLIAMENCKYPRVREALKLARVGRTAEPTTYTQLIQNLRADLAQEKSHRKLLQLQMSEQFTARMRAEESVKRADKLISKLRKEIFELQKIKSLSGK